MCCKVAIVPSSRCEERAANLGAAVSRQQHANAVPLLTCKYDTRYPCYSCLLYTSPSPRDLSTSRMPSSA